jgi:5-methylthioadenosine/S-adenosylhomocysteine deaminase
VRKSVASDAAVHDLGDAALLPGLVNAHVHLELSFMADPPLPGGDYMTWLRQLVRRREESFDQGGARAAAEAAVRLLVSRGTVGVGDVGNGTWIAGVLARSSLRGVLFHEVYGFQASDAERILDDAAVRLDRIEADPDVRAARARLRVALTPHAPHTLSSALLKALAGRAVASQEPLSIHLAESMPEAELIHTARGRWRSSSGSAACGTRPSGPPDTRRSSCSTVSACSRREPSRCTAYISTTRTFRGSRRAG